MAPDAALGRADHAFHAVVFDNDGVLVDSEPLTATSLAGSLTDAGVPMTAEDVAQTFQGQTLIAVTTWVEANRGVTLPASFDEQVHRDAMSRLERELRPVPGVREVIVALHSSDIPVAVASNSARQRVLRSLEICGLDDLLPPNVVATVDDVPHGKPAPDVYEAAATRIGVEPHRCTAVEDSATGIAAARAAGMYTIGFTARSKDGELRDADHRVASMTALRRLFEM